MYGSLLTANRTVLTSDMVYGVGHVLFRTADNLNHLEGRPQFCDTLKYILVECNSWELLMKHHKCTRTP